LIDQILVHDASKPWQPTRSRTECYPRGLTTCREVAVPARAPTPQAPASELRHDHHKAPGSPRVEIGRSHTTTTPQPGEQAAEQTGEQAGVHEHAEIAGHPLEFDPRVGREASSASRGRYCRPASTAGASDWVDQPCQPGSFSHIASESGPMYSAGSTSPVRENDTYGRHGDRSHHQHRPPCRPARARFTVVVNEAGVRQRGFQITVYDSSRCQRTILKPH